MARRHEHQLPRSRSLTPEDVQVAGTTHLLQTTLLKTQTTAPPRHSAAASENGAKRSSASSSSPSVLAEMTPGAADTDQARAGARARARARMRRIAPEANSPLACAAGRPARGIHMNCHSLSLADLHERHARHARTLNKSEKTITWYATALTDFCRFLEEACDVQPPATLGDFTLEAVRDYILYLRGRSAFREHPFMRPRERPLSDASVNCYVRALRTLASWLYEQEYTETNLLGRLKAPRMTQKAVEILADAEIARILKALASPNASNVRNRAIFLTLLDTGIRASELLTLTIPRAHLEDGYLLVLGKGKKERPVKIGQTAAQAIRLYLTRYRPEPVRPGCQEVFLSEGYRVSHATTKTFGPAHVTRSKAPADGMDMETMEDGAGGQEGDLLFTEPGWPLSESALKHLFQRLGRRAGVPRLHPHLLRHTYACRYLLAHRDPIVLKTMLGHTTLTMTNHYLSAVEGMEVIRSDRVSIVDALELNIGRLKRGNPRGRRQTSA